MTTRTQADIDAWNGRQARIRQFGTIPDPNRGANLPDPLGDPVGFFAAVELEAANADLDEILAVVNAPVQDTSDEALLAASEKWLPPRARSAAPPPAAS